MYTDVNCPFGSCTDHHECMFHEIVTKVNLCNLCKQTQTLFESQSLPTDMTSVEIYVHKSC